MSNRPGNDAAPLAGGAGVNGHVSRVHVSNSSPVERLLDRLRAAGHEPRRSGDNWTCRCPAHKDRAPSLSVAIGSRGQALLHCHAGCTVEEIVAALGLTLSDLFADAPRPSARRGRGARKSSSSAAGGCTLAAYAEAKRLPVEFLARLGLEDRKYQGAPAVRIPYRTAEAPGPVRFRTALDGEDRFRWQRGAKPILYGIDRLEAARRRGYIVLVEGESDCHTLWFHDLPAAGVPGAANWNEQRYFPLMEGIDTVFVVREPDKGGDALIRKLAGSSLRDRVRIVQLRGFKDPSAMHVDDPGAFAARWGEAAEEAVPLGEELCRDRKRQRVDAAGVARNLINAPDILALFIADLGRAGVVGEDRAAKLIYLALTSRLLNKPVSLVLKGVSSAGKSHTTNSVLGFFPSSAYHALSAMSEHALVYSEEPLAHRALVIYEAAGLNTETANYLLRSLLSEGRIRYETVERTSDGMRPRLIERGGPTNVIVTTTRLRLHQENETRMLSVPVNDTPAQTSAILERMTEEPGEAVDLAPWHALQDWLATGDSEVVIPFAKAIVKRMPPAAVRLRRDFGSVLALVQAHALLHQAHRGREKRGRIIAEPEDYRVVRGLIEDLISDGVGASVPASIRETVAAVTELRDQDHREVCLRDVAERLGLDKSAASRRCRAALESGYLINLEERRGRPARLVLGQPMPEDIGILPPPEVLHGCSDAAGETHAT